MTKSAHQLIDAGTTLPPGQNAGATIDLRTAGDALLTANVRTGSPGPTAGLRITLYVAHEDGATPAFPAPAWQVLGNPWTSGVTANERYAFSLELPRAVMHLAVEFRGGTGAAVQVEAGLSVAD